jgi:hypothetical protein
MRRLSTLLGLLLAVLLGGMDATIVGAVLPSALDDIGGLATYGLAFSIYIFAAAVSVPAWGPAADRWGRRRIFLTGVGVFLAGVSEGLMPISLAETDDAVAEERRLLYVGVTRAREHLTLSFALTRRKWGKPHKTIPSRFLYEMTGQAESFPPRNEQKSGKPKRRSTRKTARR